MSRDGRNPNAEINAANPWYVEDQFAVQLGSGAFRSVVENRWRVFSAAIDEWVRLAERPPERMLDAGCGDGINLSYFSRFVLERQWPTKLVGADYSPLRVSRAANLDASRLVRGSITAAAFANATFDIVLCNQVLEHVPDFRQALREFRRILTPGGLLLIGVPNEGSALGLLRNRLLQRSIMRSTDHVNMFTRRSLFHESGAADLRVVRFEPEGFFVPHTVLHGVLNAWQPMQRSLNSIGRLFPSCAAGLLLVATRPR